MTATILRGGHIPLRGAAMYTVTREIRFCYAHRLPSPDHTWRHLHGHNARLLITLATEDLDRIGMVMDFTYLKRVVGGWVGEHLDHKTILHREDPLVAVLRQKGEPVFTTEHPPSAACLARLVFDFAVAQSFPVTEVRLYVTDHVCSIYRGTTPDLH